MKMGKEQADSIMDESKFPPLSPFRLLMFSTPILFIMFKKNLNITGSAWLMITIGTGTSIVKQSGR